MRLLIAWLAGWLAATAGLLGLYVLVSWARLPRPAELPPEGDPGPTAFMAQDGCEQPQRRFRQLDEIDSRLVCTVVWSEDRQFFHHDGVDRPALRSAIERTIRERRFSVGASTITMQLARNLYLSRARNPSRKLAEIAIARRIDRSLSKARQLELYLNSAEWAPCVYGIDAASHHYFGHGADRLDFAESVVLASALPHPARSPLGSGDMRNQLVLLKRVGRLGLMTSVEFLAAQRDIMDRHRDGWRRPAGPAPRSKGLPLGLCGTTPVRDLDPD